ncbi:hypothetical protein R5R35_002603 [Gryllus longicercus]|uniref:CHK kinase-like domain-containing protein n=1 Tax=Gryllus longicercus TaxID=2509291 RepID=A0AAN9VW88_9ORTH
MGSSKLLSNAEWAPAVENCLGMKQFEVLNYVLRPLGSTGGFLGDHYTAEVTVRLHEDKNIQKILHFFLKTEPKAANDCKITKQINVFKKEVDTLNIIFVKMKSVLKEGGKNMVWACKCFYTQPEFIILEDLSKQGFRSFTLRDSLRYEHFELTMKALANMHAASIIFEEAQSKQPYRLIDDYPDVLEEALFRHAPNHPGTRWIMCSIKTMWLLVELIHGKDALSEVKSELERIMLSLYDLQKPSGRFRNVVCQGDVKRDNILFRHENGIPVDVRIVDYQFTRYAPPANDIMCFFYLSSYKSFRDRHFTELLTVYYHQFSKNLWEHGLDPEKLLSWRKFKESCDFYRIVGLLIGACYCPGTYISPENIKHVFDSSEVERYIYDDRDQEVKYSFYNDDFYKENVEDIVNELLEYTKKSKQK